MVRNDSILKQNSMTNVKQNSMTNALIPKYSENKPIRLPGRLGTNLGQLAKGTAGSPGAAGKKAKVWGPIIPKL